MDGMDKMDEKKTAERGALIPRHGGYRKLKSFQVAELVYDVTVRFCERYIERRSRTHDQMVQATRSGVQNIAEGSQASGTSKKTELKLTNVARARLEELRLDFEDFLRHRGLPQWARDDRRRAELIALRPTSAEAVAAWARELHARERRKADPAGQDGRDGQHGRNGQGFCTSSMSSTSSTSSMSSTPSTSARPASYPEIAANAALALIAVAGSLLDRQLAAQAAAFEREGGFTERLHRVRTVARKENQ
jgi:four helix bundle suffix protein